MSRLIFVLAFVAVFASSASAVVAPNQASYLWNGLYNQTTGDLVAGFGSFNQYCQPQAVGFVSYFCNQTVRVQYNCNSSNCTDCVEVVNENPEFVGALSVNTTGGNSATFNLTTFCSIDKDAFARNLTSLTRDITLAVYARDSTCAGTANGADYYVAAPVGSCVAIEQYQSPFSITAAGVTVYAQNNTACNNSLTSDIIVPLTPYNATAEVCVGVASPATSTLRLGFQTAITTTGIQTTDIQTTDVPTTAVASTTVSTTVQATGAAATTVAQASTTAQVTGVAATTVAQASTTGVVTTTASTTVVQTTAVIQTTGIQTTGIQTTGIQTTGVQTTGVQTTGRSTNGASTLSVASLFVVVAAIAVALF